MTRFLVGAAVIVAVGGMLFYLVLGPSPAEERWFALGWIAWAPVGGLILLRRPRNGVGLTMLLIGLGWGLSFLTNLFSASNAPLELRAWSDLAGVLLGIVPFLGIVWLVLIFPTGRLEGTIERVAAAILALVTAAVVLSFTVTTESMEGPTGLASPLATPWLESAISWLVSPRGVWVLVTLVFLAVFSLVRRWAKSGGVERHQYRWLLLGALVFAIVLAIGQVAPEESNGIILWVVAGTAIPLVIGIAVSRYRLYDIDRIISRTFSYALAVGLLVAVIAGIAAIVGALFQEVAGAQFEEPWVVAATTLGVVALFNPVRRRVQVWVDRRFNRSRFDAERVMDQFAGSLRGRVDANQLVDGWLDVVEHTMQPEAVGVWLRG